jgi:hypothetical protein
MATVVAFAVVSLIAAACSSSSSSSKATSPTTKASGASAQAPTSAAGGAPSVPPVTQGVTADKIVIGVAAIAVAGAPTIFGDTAEHYRAVYNAMKQQGLIPVNGRDVQFAIEKFNINDPVSERAACVKLVQDDKAFMVVGESNYILGASCVAGDNKTPLVQIEGQGDSVYTSYAPYVFSLYASVDRYWRNFMAWADQGGYLKGKKIGLYWYSVDTNNANIVNKVIKPFLSSKGYNLAAEVSTTDCCGGPTDAVAVQRMKAAGVNLMINLLGNKVAFQTAALGQGWTAQWLDNDFDEATSPGLAGTYPPAEEAGALGMTVQNPEDQQAQPDRLACDQALAAEEAKRPQPPKPPTPQTFATNVDYGVENTACAIVQVALEGMRLAGPTLNHATFIAGLQQVKNLQTPNALVSFGPGRYDGGTQFLAQQYTPSCKCFTRVGTWQPLLVP